MAMGQRTHEEQTGMWVAVSELPRSVSHPFYEKLNRLLAEHGFDDFVETQCRSFYAEKMGRPSLAPGQYFRLLLLGYFEGLDSERGIAWRAADSSGVRAFLGLALTEAAPGDGFRFSFLDFLGRATPSALGRIVLLDP